MGLNEEMRFEQWLEEVGELAVPIQGRQMPRMLERNEQRDEISDQVRERRGQITWPSRMLAFLCVECGAIDLTYTVKGSLWLRINRRGQREKQSKWETLE